MTPHGGLACDTSVFGAAVIYALFCSLLIRFDCIAEGGGDTCYLI